MSLIWFLIYKTYPSKVFFFRFHMCSTLIETITCMFHTHFCLNGQNSHNDITNQRNNINFPKNLNSLKKLSIIKITCTGNHVWSLYMSFLNNIIIVLIKLCSFDDGCNMNLCKHEFMISIAQVTSSCLE